MDTKIKIELPSKPSELIRVAIADLEKIERDPRYRVKMSRWHEAPNPDVVALNPNHGLKCDVCLAGAALACHGYPIDQSLNGVDNIEDGLTVRNKIMALDMFRNGRVSDGLRLMGSAGFEDVRMHYKHDVPDYHVQPEGFKIAMLDMADTLAENGY